MRVLVVEDDASLSRLLRRALTAEGVHVDLAGDGREGLLAALGSEYDAVVLDIMLPGMNGYKVVERMRAAEIWTPVLMLTAKDGPYDQVDAFDLGADDYLTKPFDFVVLLARLRALVRRGAPKRPAVLTAGDLTMDPASRQVHRAGTEIRLTAKEYALLEYFIRRQDRVLAKTQILDAVWDSSFSGEVNIVEVYVGYLRKKIDLPFGTTSIDTVRGTGYRFRAASMQPSVSS